MVHYLSTCMDEFGSCAQSAAEKVIGFLLWLVVLAGYAGVILCSMVIFM